MERMIVTPSQYQTWRTDLQVTPSEDLAVGESPVPERFENMTLFEIQRCLRQMDIKKPYFLFMHGMSPVVMKHCPFPFQHYGCTHTGHVMAHKKFTFDPLSEDMRWDMYIPSFVNPSLSQFEPCVTLYSAYGEHVNLIVKYLVAWTFLPNPQQYHYVQTKNRSVIDIHIQNLEWVPTPDPEENKPYIPSVQAAPLTIDYPLHPVSRLYTSSYQRKENQ